MKGYEGQSGEALCFKGKREIWWTTMMELVLQGDQENCVWEETTTMERLLPVSIVAEHGTMCHRGWKS